MRWGIVCLAQLLGTAVTAEPVREPLVVTRLPDPETDFVAVSGARPDPLDEAIKGFTAAISQANLVEQQALQARCKSATAGAVGSSARMAWEANCRYRRR